VKASGVTLGYHRCYDRAFRPHRPTEYRARHDRDHVGAGPVNIEVADHRKHHATHRSEGDPHSPTSGAGSCSGGVHAQVGGLVSEEGRASSSRYAARTREYHGMRGVALVPAVSRRGWMEPATATRPCTGWKWEAFFAGLLWAAWCASSS